MHNAAGAIDTDPVAKGTTQKRATRTPDPSRTRRSAEEASDTRASSERRAEIVRIAAELFAERGYKATTVRAIGDAAGVLSGSLYYHFDSKESIADELFTSYFDELLSTYHEIAEREDDPRAAFRALVTAAFESIGQHHAAVIVVQNEQRYLSEFERFAYLGERQHDVEQLWLDVLRSGIEAEVFRDTLDPKIVYRFVRDAIGTSARWYRPDGGLKLSDLAEQYLTMILDGIVVPRRRNRRPRSTAATGA